MTPAIISQFYDKFLSLKNEPRINQTTFFVRMLFIFMPAIILFYIFGNQPNTEIILCFLIWYFHIGSFIQVIKRTHDFNSKGFGKILLMIFILFQSIVIWYGYFAITDTNYDNSWGNIGWMIFILLIYPISQFFIYWLLSIIPGSKKDNEYWICKKTNWWIVVLSMLLMGIAVYTYVTNLW